MNVGEWYRWRKDNGDAYSPRHAYQIIAIGRDFVIIQFSASRPAFYTTKADFDTEYELIARPQ